MLIEQLLDDLHSRGLRYSRNRRALLEALQAHPRLSADEIHLKLPASQKPNRTTVYRELDRLVGAGVVRELDFGEGKKRYELNDGTHHHHLFCQSCEKIQCVSIGQHLAATEQALQEQYQFQVKAHHLEFFGLCANCTLPTEEINQ